jgi:hypothetical protein
MTIILGKNKLIMDKISTIIIILLMLDYFKLL